MISGIHCETTSYMAAGLFIYLLKEDKLEHLSYARH